MFHCKLLRARFCVERLSWAEVPCMDVPAAMPYFRVHGSSGKRGPCIRERGGRMGVDLDAEPESGLSSP